MCLRLLCDTHTPPDLFSNSILLASANAFPRAPASALLACQPQGWHCGFQNLITATVPRPPRLPPRLPPLSFRRINFCSSQLQPFDVRNDEAVEIGIDTSEDRGGGNHDVHGSSIFSDFSPIDKDCWGRGPGRGCGRGLGAAPRLLLSTDQLQRRQASVTCDSQCQFHARGNHLRKSRAGFTFDKKSAAFVFVKRRITECDRSQRLPASADGPSGVCQGPASIYFKWVPPRHPPQAGT